MKKQLHPGTCCSTYPRWLPSLTLFWTRLRQSQRCGYSRVLWMLRMHWPHVPLTLNPLEWEEYENITRRAGLLCKGNIIITVTLILCANIRNFNIFYNQHAVSCFVLLSTNVNASSVKLPSLLWSPSWTLIRSDVHGDTLKDILRVLKMPQQTLSLTFGMLPLSAKRRLYDHFPCLQESQSSLRHSRSGICERIPKLGFCGIVRL